MITSDYNFIRVDFYAEYRISDPVKALYASEDPVRVLDNIAQNCIRTTIGSYTVDAVLTTGKNEIQANIRDMIMEKLEAYDIGIQLVSITIQDAQPPTAEVIEAFKAVETAKQGKDTALNNANKYRNEEIPQGGGARLIRSCRTLRRKRRAASTRRRARWRVSIPCMRSM